MFFKMTAFTLLAGMLLLFTSCDSAGAGGEDVLEEDTSSQDSPTSETPQTVNAFIAATSVAADDESITLTWTETGTSTIDHITIDYAPRKGQSQQTQVSAGTGTLTLNSLDAKTQYTLTMRAVTASGAIGDEHTLILMTARSGETADYTFVTSADELDKVRDNLSGAYLLMNDIDLSGISGWTFLSTPRGPFTGLFCGNGFAIRGLTISSGDGYQGLFGLIDEGIISSLSVTDADIEGGDYTGILAGESDNGLFIDCNSSGHVTGGESVGGLIGLIDDETLILGCSSSASVTGTYEAGGLIGKSEDNANEIIECYATGNIIISGMAAGGLVGNLLQGSIIDCYAGGSIEGQRFLGGLVGDTSGKVTRSYSYGSLRASESDGTLGGLISSYDAPPEVIDASLTACFYDGQTSGYEAAVASGNGDKWAQYGTAKTTAEMKTEATFTQAGWDFAGESANGSEDIWDISSSINNGYPYLTALADSY